MGKYGNYECVVEGERFDSIREALRWQELRMMEKAGEISGIERQVTYELIPKQPGERAVKYIADFRYKDRNGLTVVEDAKGMKTKDYIIKRKLLLYMHGIKIVEV